MIPFFSFLSVPSWFAFETLPYGTSCQMEFILNHYSRFWITKVLILCTNAWIPNVRKYLSPFTESNTSVFFQVCFKLASPFPTCTCTTWTEREREAKLSDLEVKYSLIFSTGFIMLVVLYCTGLNRVLGQFFILLMLTLD